MAVSFGCDPCQSGCSRGHTYTWSRCCFGSLHEDVKKHMPLVQEVATGGVFFFLNKFKNGIIINVTYKRMEKVEHVVGQDKGQVATGGKVKSNGKRKSGEIRGEWGMSRREEESSDAVQG